VDGQTGYGKTIRTILNGKKVKASTLAKVVIGMRSQRLDERLAVGELTDRGERIR
jgi:hypothetical protein